MKRHALHRRYGHSSGVSASDEAAKARLKREGFEPVSYGNYYRRKPPIAERIIAPWYGGQKRFYAQIEEPSVSALKGYGPASLPACLKRLREQETERGAQ